MVPQAKKYTVQWYNKSESFFSRAPKAEEIQYGKDMEKGNRTMRVVQPAIVKGNSDLSKENITL